MKLPNLELHNPPAYQLQLLTKVTLCLAFPFFGSSGISKANVEYIHVFNLPWCKKNNLNKNVLNNLVFLLFTLMINV